MSIAIAALIGYLLGSISFSYIIAKRVAGIDIRARGSGNAGATNTLRVLGKGPAALVLLLDVLKGVAAVLLAFWIAGGNPTGMALAGFMAVIGHNWPLFFGFRGGKGVATTIGVVGFLSFFSFFWAGLATLIVIFLTRYVSLGSLVFFALVPILMLIRGEPFSYVATAIAIAAIGYARHRQNISRLLRGSENKIGVSK